MELKRSLMWVRRWHGLSQNSLAKLVDVSPGYIRIAETQREPSGGLLAKVAEGFGFPVMFFYFLQDAEHIEHEYPALFAAMTSVYPLLHDVYEMESKAAEGKVDDRSTLPKLLQNTEIHLEELGHES